MPRPHTPHHSRPDRHHADHHAHHMSGHRRFAAFMSRMGGDPDSMGFGDDFRIGRLLGGGDLRLVVLLLLSEAPRHGYDLIKAIEEKSASVYSPSPGVIYPALTYLEEAGYALSEADGNKKVYEITAAGRTHLDQNRTDAEAVLDGLGHIGKRAEFMRTKLRERREGRHEHQRVREDRDIPGVSPEVNQARKALKAAISTAINGDEETQAKLAGILQNAADDISRLDVDLG